MNWVAVVVALVALAVALAVFAWKIWPNTATEIFDRALRRRVVVHTGSGHSIDGVLAGIYASGVVLEHATYLRMGDSAVPLDGAQIFPWVSVDWIQELTDAISVPDD